MTALDLSLIGTSDQASVLNLSDRPGPSGLYNRIKYGIEPPPKPWFQEMGELGKLYEFPTAMHGVKKLGIDPALLEKPDSIRHPGGDQIFRYSLDPIIRERGHELLTEIKMRAKYRLEPEGWGPDGSPIVPPAVFVQIQAALAFLRLDRDRWVGTELPDLEVVHVIVGVDCREVRIHPVPRRSDVGDGILEAGRAWWSRHIKRGIAPPVDGSESARLALLARFPKSSGIVRPASKGENALFRRLERAEAAFDKAKKKHAVLEQELERRIGPALGIRISDGRDIKWSDRKGYVKQREVIDALAKRLELSAVELKEIEEYHRGKDFRVLGWKEAKQ